MDIHPWLLPVLTWLVTSPKKLYTVWVNIPSIVFSIPRMSDQHPLASQQFVGNKI